jgi:eukaryotic-like serine/threonine-protein kinase
MVMPFRAGTVVADRFWLERRLGKGGMAEVWAVRDLSDGTERALKFLHEPHEGDGFSRRRFLRELHAMRALQHPNVVHAHECIQLRAGLALVMELLRGEDLRRRLDRQQTLDLCEFRSIMLAVVDGIRFAHAEGVVHRDLKPENIFLCTDGAVKVLDFGLAKFLPGASAGDASYLTELGTVLGTPSYMSPEQILGGAAVDQRADVWAIGVIMYEALCGCRPFEGMNRAHLLSSILTGAVTPVEIVAPQVPAALGVVVMQLLARDPSDRPSDLQAVRDVLSELDQ